MTQTISHSPADILRRLLIRLGLGADPRSSPWPVFAAVEPSKPDETVTVYDTQGQSDGRSMIDGEAYRHYGFQVRVRSTDHPRGWLKADAVRRALTQAVENESVAVDGVEYLVRCAAKVGQVLPLGIDNPATKRSLFTLNGLLALGIKAAVNVNVVVPPVPVLSFGQYDFSGAGNGGLLSTL